MFHTNVVEKTETQILGLVFFVENRAVYEITWTNLIEPERPQMIVWRMRISG
jgi:hypothetical protein